MADVGSAGERGGAGAGGGDGGGEERAAEGEEESAEGLSSLGSWRSDGRHREWYARGRAMRWGDVEVGWCSRCVIL